VRAVAGAGSGRTKKNRGERGRGKIPKLEGRRERLHTIAAVTSSGDKKLASNNLARISPTASGAWKRTTGMKALRVANDLRRGDLRQKKRRLP